VGNEPSVTTRRSGRGPFPGRRTTGAPGLDHLRQSAQPPPPRGAGPGAPVAAGGAPSPSTCTAAPNTARPRPAAPWARRPRPSRARHVGRSRRGSSPRPGSRSAPRCDGRSSTVPSAPAINPTSCPLPRPDRARADAPTSRAIRP
jgi:hypothetical protein